MDNVSVPSETGGKYKHSILEFWRDYNRSITGHSSYTELCTLEYKLEFMYSLQETDSAPRINLQIMGLVKKIGFYKVHQSNVMKMLEMHADELSN
jgi:hypothetical protein